MEVRTLNVASRFLHHEFLDKIQPDALAVIAYGHLRTFLHCLPSTLKSLSALGTPHLFIHTWDRLEAGDHGPLPGIDIPGLLRSVCDNARVISIQVDCQPADFIGLHGNPPRTLGQAYMYYSMWSANNLKKHQENSLLARYSRCIKLRPDIFLDCNLETLSHSVDYLFCADDRRHSDICALTSSQTMDRVCSYIGRMDCRIPREAQMRSYFEYMSEGLGLKKAPLTYGKDWWILRSALFKAD